MRNLVFLAVFFLTPSCAVKKISGIYHSENCDGYATNCFIYNFHSDGTFTYWYSSEMAGEVTLYGSYYLIGDSVKLTPEKYIFHDSSSVEYFPQKVKNKINIKISLIPGYLKNKPDTMHVPWLIKTDKMLFFDETDEEGNYEIDDKDVKTIEIADYSMKFQLEEADKGSSALISVEKQNCDIKVNLSSETLEPFVIEPVKKFLISGKKLIAVYQESDTLGMPIKPPTEVYVRERL
jgi:hypothetical protein